MHPVARGVSGQLLGNVVTTREAPWTLGRFGRQGKGDSPANEQRMRTSGNIRYFRIENI